ncbi:MAG: GDSL-type esterase/lipase family protein [Clostridiales bacterium]|nr:GDSL-type esterase/lipase family protein [Clostridiales bacterium]
MKAKRILPLVLSLAMAGGAFAGIAGCNNGGSSSSTGGGGGTVTHQNSHKLHYTDNEDGATHTVTCEVEGCDYVVQNNVSHTSTDSCTDCGWEKQGEGGHKHSYLQHKATCDGCDEPNPKATTFSGWDGTDNGFTDDHVSKIYVVGDSTVCDYSLSPQKFDNDRFLPRYGYGTQLHEYLNYTSENVVNLAISGRSAVSLMGEPNYTTLVNSIGEGDYLIIGFGHNDEKLEPNRFGDPEGNTTEAVTDRGDSWKYILNENYIKLAKHRGATPILCTPIVRYDKKGEYTGNYIHDTEYGDYPAAIKALAEETETVCVDLTTITKNTWIAAGENSTYFHSVSEYAGDIVSSPYNASVLPDFDTIDGTHINKYGAKMVAYQLANALKTTSVSSIVREGITAPVKDDEYVGAINQSYTKSDYASFNPANNSGQLLTDDWYKTAFGDLGGSYSASNLTATHSGGTFTVAYAGKGKIADGGDGYAAIFKQLPKDADFSISAHVKVTEFIASTSENQAGFGIMLRDDIYVNTVKASLKTAYVTAGALTNSKGTDTAAFSRVNGSGVTKGTELSADVALNSEYDISMTKTGTTVTVTFGTVSETFTNISLTSVDSNYMYLCLFANRGIKAVFTDVNFSLES